MFRHFAEFASGVVNSTFGAAESLAASYVSVAVMSYLGYENPNLALIGSRAIIGNVSLSGIAGSYNRNLSGCGFFRKDYNKNLSACEIMLRSSAYIGFKLLCALMGQCITKVLDPKVEELNESLCLLLTLGAALTVVPMWLVDNFLYQPVGTALTGFARWCKHIDMIDKFDDAEPKAIRKLSLSPRHQALPDIFLPVSPGSPHVVQSPHLSPKKSWSPRLVLSPKKSPKRSTVIDVTADHSKSRVFEI